MSFYRTLLPKQLIDIDSSRVEMYPCVVNATQTLIVSQKALDCVHNTVLDRINHLSFICSFGELRIDFSLTGERVNICREHTSIEFFFRP